MWDSGRHYGAGSIYPLITKAFSGKPEVIESAAHHKQRLKEKGWTLRDDAAWEEGGDYLGAKWNKAKQKWEQVYSTSSGMGTKRTWI